MQAGRCPLSALLAAAALACTSTAPAAASALWEVTNEVAAYPERAEMAPCHRSAVCGLVQANAWGVSSQPLCQCAGRQQCPLRWDSEDGHSVTHGSDQYKFCGLAPPLAPCAAGQLALTDELVTYHEEGRPMSHHEQLHCRCPAGHRLLQTDSQWHPMPDGDLIRTEKSCVQMPECAAGQHCKFVTRTLTATLVQVNCACPGRMTCPSDADSAVDTVSMGRGFLHSVFCR